MVNTGVDQKSQVGLGEIQTTKVYPKLHLEGDSAKEFLIDDVGTTGKMTCEYKLVGKNINDDKSVSVTLEVQSMEITTGMKMIDQNRYQVRG